MNYEHHLVLILTILHYKIVYLVQLLYLKTQILAVKSIQAITLDSIEKEVFHPQVVDLVIFGADMSSSPHIDNKGKDKLILERGPTQGLSEDSLTAEKMYSINFKVMQKKFCLSLHYNGANSYLFVNGKEIIKFKAKDSIVAAHYV